ncbi:MAG: metal-dependent transcriptional regulator [Spirochaetota bacterium]
MSITTENYLKTIYAYSESHDAQMVPLGEVARSLGVTPGTVTTMMKSLADAGLVEYLPRKGVTLTRSGRTEALGVVRRHRLIELFLVEILGLDWADVHDEAEVLEHAMSDRLLSRIDELLGYPESDPHGDPIPGPDGLLPKQAGLPLAEAPVASTVRIVRVEHEETGFLSFLSETGLTPGAEVGVVDRSSAAGTVTVNVSGERLSLSIQTARKIRVQIVYSGSSEERS